MMSQLQNRVLYPFSGGNFSVNEDGSATTEVTVTRTGGSDGEVSVTVTPTDGTATAPDDYTSDEIVVIFGDGETSKTVNIPISDDSVVEGDETINLSLSGATGGANLGSQDTAVLTIVDNDEQPDTSANDTLIGNSEDNTLNGFDGDDVIQPGAGNNVIFGGDGFDTLSYDYNTAGVNADLSTGVALRKLTTTSDSPLKILPLGDSNTRGFPNRADNGGYRTQLFRDLNGAGFNVDFIGRLASGPSDIDRDHEGRGGFTIDQLTNGGGPNFPQPAGVTPPEHGSIEDALAGNPDVIVLKAGTNDIIQGDDADTAIADLEVLVDRITAELPDAQLLVASIIANTSSPIRESRTIEFNSRIEDEVVNPAINLGKNVTFVDIFNTPGLSASDFNSDGIHLLDSGYDKVGEAFGNALLNINGGQDTFSGIEKLIGSAFNDTLSGNADANTIEGGGGDDTITGGAGNDVFVFASGDGTDIITDFEIGFDLIGLSGGLTFEDLIVTQGSGSTANNTSIEVASNNEILASLNGVDARDITSDSFTIV